MKRPASRVLALIMSLVLTFAMITPLSASAATQTAARGPYKTTATSLNLRSKASAKSSIVCVFAYGTSITVTDTSNSAWYKCFYKAGSTTYSGYVSSSYVKLAKGASYVTTKKTSMMTGAGTGTSQFEYPAGTYVDVTSTKNASWYKVYYRNSKGATFTGYVAASALKVAKVPANLGVGTGRDATGGLIVSGATTTSTAIRYKVTASSLNFRSGPGTQYSIYLTLPKNTVVTLVSAANANWYKVDYTNSKGVTYRGYVSSHYLTRVY